MRIAQISGQVAELGLASLISFIAVLSVNLGLINLFPIPVLDGGHLVFYLAEAVRGRPLPLKAQEYAFRGGLAVLASLFVFATWICVCASNAPISTAAPPCRGKPR